MSRTRIIFHEFKSMISILIFSTINRNLFITILPNELRECDKKIALWVDRNKMSMNEAKRKILFYTNTQTYSIRSNVEKIRIKIMMEKEKKNSINNNAANWWTVFIACWIECMIFSWIRNRSVYVKVWKILGLNGKFPFVFPTNFI